MRTTEIEETLEAMCRAVCLVPLAWALGGFGTTQAEGADLDLSATGVPPWTAAPWSDPQFFPIAVWLQNPIHAARYRTLGINTYADLVVTSEGDASVAHLVKRLGEWGYVFAVNMRNAPTEATFTWQSGLREGDWEVLEEDRRVAMEEGGWKDSFEPWAVHLYRRKL